MLYPNNETRGSFLDESNDFMGQKNIVFVTPDMTYFVICFVMPRCTVLCFSSVCFYAPYRFEVCRISSLYWTRPSQKSRTNVSSYHRKRTNKNRQGHSDKYCKITIWPTDWSDKWSTLQTYKLTDRLTRQMSSDSEANGPNTHIRLIRL